MKTLIESIIGRRGATKRDKSNISTGDIFWFKNTDIFGVVWLPEELNSFVNKFSQVLTNPIHSHSIPTTNDYPEGMVVFGLGLNNEVCILDLSRFDNNFYYHGEPSLEKMLNSSPLTIYRSPARTWWLRNGIKSIQHDNIRNIIKSGVTKIFER